MPAAVDEQRIFDAALKVVTERGYVGATTKLIAEEAGIGEVTLFRRFENKDKLILEAMKREATKLDGETSLYTGDLESDLARIATAYQELLQVRGAFMITFINEVIRYPELTAALEFPQRRIGAILELLQRYQYEGKLKAAEPLQQLAALFGPIIMITVFGQIGLAATSLDIEQHVRNFLYGQAV
jgi:AcrR family transcriptional regulator